MDKKLEDLLLIVLMAERHLNAIEAKNCLKNDYVGHFVDQVDFARHYLTEIRKIKEKLPFDFLDIINKFMDWERYGLILFLGEKVEEEPEYFQIKIPDKYSIGFHELGIFVFKKERDSNRISKKWE